MYDLIIKNGSLIDGTGGAAFAADLAISGGKIARIAPQIDEDAVRVIDAAGLTVTPGFIDSHSHADSAILTFPDQVEKIEQGITTSIAGQCGGTNAPISRDVDPATAGEIGGCGKRTDVYRTMGSFLRIAQAVPQGANIATMVGHRALRRAVMGNEYRAPTADELAQMQALLCEGIEAGAMGVSFGLIYPPSCYAQTDELIALAQTAAGCGGMVTAHIRNEGDRLFEAVEEFLTVLRASGARGVLSHHKAVGRKNWGKITESLAMLDAAAAEGIEVWCDVYPYCASSTSISTRFVPKELHAEGNAGIVRLLSDPEARSRLKAQAMARWGDNMDWILITQCRNHREYEGLRMPEIAARHGKDVYETVYDLIRDSGNQCNGCYFLMCEDDVETVLAHPRAMIGTDSGVAGRNTTYHPRLRGTFPRVLGRYVRERGVTSLPEMIRKMTGLPTEVYGLRGKGRLAEGYDADICVFDAETIIDRADYDACHLRAEGLTAVILGGEVVVEDAVYNGRRMGGVLLRGRS